MLCGNEERPQVIEVDHDAEVSRGHSKRLALLKAQTRNGQATWQRGIVMHQNIDASRLQSTAG